MGLVHAARATEKPARAIQGRDIAQDFARRPVFTPPNGWRLSGEGGEADRVRCSRGLGAPA